MMSLPVATLREQIDEVRFCETRTRSLSHRKKITELRAEKKVARAADVLNCAGRTLEKLSENADEIRAFLKLAPEARRAVLEYAETMAELCLEMKKREAAAAAGGPKR